CQPLPRAVRGRGRGGDGRRRAQGDSRQVHRAPETSESNDPSTGTRSPPLSVLPGEASNCNPALLRKGRPTVQLPRLPAGKPSGPERARPWKRPAPPKYRNGTLVWKPFLDGDGGEESLFSGRVASYDSDTGLYLVRYNDGDQEEMAEYELDEFVEVSSLRVAARRLCGDQ
ncbi:hypothetical protein THAOC_34533, partial [Thalassiosira oceanica]